MEWFYPEIVTCVHVTAVAPCNWTPWLLHHHCAAPQRFHSHENIPQSAQMRHLSKHFCCQIFTSLEFTLESDIHPVTNCLNQIVWDWTGGIFQPKFLDIWIGISDKCITLSAPQTLSTLAPRHPNWSPGSHLVSRENYQSEILKITRQSISDSALSKESDQMLCTCNAQLLHLGTFQKCFNDH